MHFIESILAFRLQILNLLELSWVHVVSYRIVWIVVGPSPKSTSPKLSSTLPWRQQCCWGREGTSVRMNAQSSERWWTAASYTPASLTPRYSSPAERCAVMSSRLSSSVTECRNKAFSDRRAFLNTVAIDLVWLGPIIFDIKMFIMTHEMDRAGTFSYPFSSFRVYYFSLCL